MNSALTHIDWVFVITGLILFMACIFAINVLLVVVFDADKQFLKVLDTVLMLLAVCIIAFQRIRAGKVEEADLLLAGCLLHDYLEDVNPDKFAFVDRFDAGLGEQLYNIVLNVTKTGLSTEKYIKQVSSNPVSALIKILDRLNNFSTLSESTTQHRKHQLEETEAVYLPLTEQFRVEFWEDASFYWQAKTIMEALARELHRYFKDMDLKDLEITNA